MQRLIEWLIEIEGAAADVYSRAAAFFRADAEFSSFLDRLARDEAWHRTVMDRSLACLRKSGRVEGSIKLDPDTRKRVEDPLNEVARAIDSGRVKQDTIIDSIIRAEHSEWNHLFLYVVNTLKDCDPDFVQIAPRIQHHLRFIEHWMKAYPGEGDGAQAIKNLPPVWSEKILVVDDFEPVVDLLEAFLGRFGQVHTAGSGGEALDMARRVYYAVIVSDLDMPGMNGRDFYHRLSETYADAGKRFLFVTGNPFSVPGQVLRAEGLRMLEKPFSLSGIRQAVFEIMEQNAVGAERGEADSRID